ncbi:aconitate hydratase AcnA [Rhizobium laguerreae]|uniref:aconitate hydratase AcnA n=1 Tax=Rhizobium laguerreae TaxID=1076926 RepID=UPI001C916635|nr:aconitate hydratase AcnA [Rhizobium laguerreae]MBY3321527.1 aconitate hydratase AcnA [Rhizobium laguerreae]MBY3362759.1 aconitate hydratase AcnA [Rhizobium laguerreae]
MNVIESELLQTTFTAPDGTSVGYFSVEAACSRIGADVDTLPFACRVFVENLERGQPSNRTAHSSDVERMIRWKDNVGSSAALTVGRVILPDSSGLPVLLDMAALRDAVAREGFDPAAIESSIQVDVIVDHSLQVDISARPDAVEVNLSREFERNSERYRFLKWAQQAFKSVRVFPPGTGIIHQINLEHIASVITRDHNSPSIAYPDFVLGGDSHTPMVNAIGVLGWGVGGIEAQAAILGMPYVLPVPEFVGVRLKGELPPGATVTDLVLHVTERLRGEGVVGAVVEYCGAALKSLTVPARATLSNMAPEYGATAAYFPIDQETIAYLRRTRSPEHADFVEAYARMNNLFLSDGLPEPIFSRVIEIDLGTVKRSLAGPRRPQDRLDLSRIADDFRSRLPIAASEGGFSVDPDITAAIESDDTTVKIGHGALAIAAITACTNTSNPGVMITAGLLARNALAEGLSPPPWVKTSLAPGSRVVTRYLKELGLLRSLEDLGFGVVGYGCTTCGGKSGPLLPAMSAAIDDSNIVAAAALSGNRNFEGRIHRQVRANYIMSPPLVIAFALAGRVDINLDADPLGFRIDGSAIYLSDLWPSADETANALEVANNPSFFSEVYGSPNKVRPWDEMEAPQGSRFQWEPGSTYLIEPPFISLGRNIAISGLPDRIDGARVLGAYGDSLTTDHISPSGEIPLDSAAGLYLQSLGINRANFNTYVGRRCNHKVMVRGTFANLRIKNQLVDGREGGWTQLFPSGEIVSVFEAASVYRDRKTPVIILAGRDYGMGSSRDWAAKGSALLGVRAIIAESYERIHRSNLIGMGVIPLEFTAGMGWRQLGLDGSEMVSVKGVIDAIDGNGPAYVTATRGEQTIHFEVFAAVTTESERNCLRHGGIMSEIFEKYTNTNRQTEA